MGVYGGGKKGKDTLNQLRTGSGSFRSGKGEKRSVSPTYTPL